MWSNLQEVIILVHRLLLRDLLWQRESEELDKEATTDTFLLFDKQTTWSKKAFEWIKFTLLVNWLLLWGVETDSLRCIKCQASDYPLWNYVIWLATFTYFTLALFFQIHKWPLLPLEWLMPSGSESVILTLSGYKWTEHLPVT